VAPNPPAAVDPQQRAAQALQPVVGLLAELGRLFAARGHEVALVGGPVRDALLGRRSEAADLDVTTDAHPEQVLALLDGYAETTWDVGIRFGTVGARIGGREVEITTYRAEQYDRSPASPRSTSATPWRGTCVRRDFTINAMAMRLPDLSFVDLFGGIADLAAGVIRTPGLAHDSFSDDPLRMMRAARFSAQLGFTVARGRPGGHDGDGRSARDRLRGADPRGAHEDRHVPGSAPWPHLLVDTGLAEYVLPELPLLRLEADEHHHHKDVYEHTLTVLEQAMVLEQAHEPASGPDPVLRLAALLHDIGKPRTRRFEPTAGCRSTTTRSSAPA
jgi:poly(A) polymerase